MLEIELLCGHEGCLRTDLWADGLCRPHYDRYRQTGTTAGLKKPRHLRKVRATICGVDGCPANHVHGRGYCTTHYNRWLSTGDPGPAELLYQGAPPLEGLWDIVHADPACSPATAHLFDPPDEDEPPAAVRVRRAAAAELCAGCPALPYCEQAVPEVMAYAVWAGRPKGGAGVWAGQVVLANGPRPIRDDGGYDRAPAPKSA